MEENNIEVKIIKIALLGDSCIGKTWICKSFMGMIFGYDDLATIGTDKFDKKIKLENGKEIKLSIWDTAGVERFREAMFKAIMSVHGIVLVFDVTSKKSFDNINIWINEIRDYFTENCPSIVLLGNKTDLEKDKWKVTQEEIDSLIKTKKLVYYEVSAKDNKGLNESFNYLANAAYNKVLEKQNYVKYKNFLKEAKGVEDCLYLANAAYNKVLEKQNYVKYKNFLKEAKGVEDCLFSENNKLKKVKKLKDESNHYKSEYDKLKKDYDTLKKDYENLKDDYDKLRNELNQAKNTITNFENKVKENLNEINNLNNNIRQKDDEIFKLNLKIRNIESFNKNSFKNDDILYVHFISSDQNINCPIKCLKTDTFAEVEDKLYQKYQEYRETNNKFVLKGQSVMRFKKIIENNINDGDEIELIKIE